MSKKRTTVPTSTTSAPSPAPSETAKANMNLGLQHKISRTLLLQVFSKMLSFILNVFTARLVSKDIYGYANVTLQFYYTFILFFLKECVRKALQKEVKMDEYTPKQRIRGAFNMVTVCFGVNFIMAIVTFAVTYTWYGIPGIDQTVFTLSLFFYLFASLFETLCEPSIILILDKVEYDSKVFVEGTSLFLRGLILFVLLYFDYGLLAFGIAHFLYGIIMLGLYTRVSSRLNEEGHELYSFKKVKLEKSEVYFLQPHLTQMSNMTLIGFFRFLLTEGENLVLNFTSNLTMEQQGEYSLIANLCSIICRFLLQPIEELSYSIFGKEALKDTHIEYMSKLIRNLFFLGLLIISFSQNYAYAALWILYKDQWTNESTVAILQIYGIYILTMAFNGVTEAFVMARSDKSQLRTMQYTMTISSVIFIVAMFFFVQAGPTGIVWANICNMLARIVTSMAIIKSICAERGEFGSLIYMSRPNLSTIVMIVSTYFVCAWGKSQYEQTNLLMHIGIGGVCALLCLATHVLSELRILKF